MIGFVLENDESRVLFSNNFISILDIAYICSIDIEAKENLFR